MALTQISTQGIKDGTITGTDLATNVDLVDNQKIRLGTGNDLQIYHDGSNSYLQNNTGLLYVRGGGDWLALQAEDGENSIICKPNGTVELYHDNSKKLETKSDGVLVTGEIQATTLDINGSSHLDGTAVVTGNLDMPDNAKVLLGTGDDLQIYHNGSQDRIDSSSSFLILEASNHIFRNNGGTEDYAKFLGNGAVELYHNNSKKAETSSAGFKVTGACFVNDGSASGNRLSVGNGGDLKLFHTNPNSFISDTSSRLVIKGNIVDISDTNGDKMAELTKDADVKLFHNGSQKFQTLSSGVKIKNTITIEEESGSESYQLSVNSFGGLDINNDTTKIAEFTDASTFNLLDNIKLTCGTGSDLQIYHSGTQSYVTDQGTGNLNLQGTSKVVIGNAAHNENMAQFFADGAVELYHNNNKKFETTSGGVKVTGGTLNMDSTAMQFSGNLALPNVGACIFRPVADTVAFGINNGQRVSVNQHGLLFGTDTAAANALDDYEEGTFTPTISSGVSAVHFNSRSGKYTKIGNTVHVTFHMNISSATLNSSALKFGNLPFTSVNSSNLTGGFRILASTGNIPPTDTYRVVNNSTEVQVITAAGDARAANSTSINAGNRILSYFGFYYVS